MVLPVDVERLLRRVDALSRIGRGADGGVTRLAFTPEDMQGNGWLLHVMREAGLLPRMDVIGNVFGRLDGADRLAPVVMAGSHIDTVPGAGKFDGTLGVLAAVEAVEAMRAAGLRPRHPIEVVSFCYEEGIRFGGGLTGSRALVGELAEEELMTRKDRDGVKLYDAMRFVGLHPGHLADVRRPPGSIHAYMELHVEQGPVLDAEKLPIGVVTRIAGPLFLRLKLIGEAAHAGSTPMTHRRDPMAAAAEAVLAVERAAKAASKETVATVGRAAAKPGAGNVIPAEVELSVDVRDVEKPRREETLRAIKEKVAEIARKRKVDAKWEEELRVDPIDLRGTRATAALEEGCAAAGQKVFHMASGAAHDAMILARHTDVGMLFVRSRGAHGHSPLERSDPPEVEAGARAFAHALAKISGAIP